MPTKMIMPCLLNVKKIWNSAQINLSSTWNFYRKYFSRSHNIHREIDQWNRRRFGAMYEVEEVFPWEICTYLVISFVLDITKIRNSIQMIFSSASNFWQHYLFIRNNIQWEIDHWNQHRYGDKMSCTCSQFRDGNKTHRLKINSFV